MCWCGYYQRLSCNEFPLDLWELRLSKVLIWGTQLLVFEKLDYIYFWCLIASLLIFHLYTKAWKKLFRDRGSYYWTSRYKHWSIVFTSPRVIHICRIGGRLKLEAWLTWNSLRRHHATFFITIIQQFL